MAHSYMVFDFGKNEEAAQQARHRIDAWKQGYRLGNKLQLKFDREENEAEGTTEEKAAKTKKKAAAKEEGRDERVRVMVRLDFSDHEKLSLQRWLDRIPTEEPFKSAEGETIRPGDPEFGKTAEEWESLE
ncbi:MAG: hypothetical protein WA875_15305 [Candidatus Acidiferrales bacterium]